MIEGLLLKKYNNCWCKMYKYISMNPVSMLIDEQLRRSRLNQFYCQQLFKSDELENKQQYMLSKPNTAKRKGKCDCSNKTLMYNNHLFFFSIVHYFYYPFYKHCEETVNKLQLHCYVQYEQQIISQSAVSDKHKGFRFRS